MSFSDIIPPHIQRIPPYKSENPAEEMERELGVKVVQLGMNENPFGASPKAVEAARAYMDQVAPYPDDTGFFLLFLRTPGGLVSALKHQFDNFGLNPKCRRHTKIDVGKTWFKLMNDQRQIILNMTGRKKIKR